MTDPSSTPRLVVDQPHRRVAFPSLNARQVELLITGLDRRLDVLGGLRSPYTHAETLEATRVARERLATSLERLANRDIPATAGLNGARDVAPGGSSHNLSPSDLIADPGLTLSQLWAVRLGADSVALMQFDRYEADRRAGYSIAVRADWGLLVAAYESLVDALDAVGVADL